jgi:Flp pilus assembly protein CpaB
MKRDMLRYALAVIAFTSFGRAVADPQPISDGELRTLEYRLRPEARYVAFPSRDEVGAPGGVLPINRNDISMFFYEGTQEISEYRGNFKIPNATTLEEAGSKVIDLLKPYCKFR